MKKKFFLIFISLNILQISTLFSQNNQFQGSIYNDTTWSSDTLELIGNVLIDSNVTLTIMPGTFVHILGYFSIQSYGSIRAIGTINDSIVFTHLDTIQHSDTSTIAGGWHGIRLLPRTTNDTSIFKFCRIENGKSVSGGSWSYDNQENKGGNLWAYGFGSLIIENTFIYNGLAKTDGAGIFCKSGQFVAINNNHIKKNTGYRRGGGIHVYEVDCLFIENNLINFNKAYSWNPPGMGGVGAGIYVVAFIGIANIGNNMIFNNKGVCGGIYDAYFQSTVSNNLICNNFGMAIYSTDDANRKYLNNTISNNYSPGDCAGFYYMLADGKLLYNSILWNNVSTYPGNPQIRSPDTDLLDVSYSDVMNEYPGVANINIDPMFVNPTDGVGLAYDASLADWSLQDNSPCINTGTPDTTGLFLPEFDLAGNPRIYGNRIDMGAYENQHVWVKINDSPAFSDQIKVYPNPGTDRIMVALPENTHEVWIELLDGTGQRVLLEHVYTNLCIFTPTGLVPGIYFFRIYNQDRVFKKGKWVKL
jgi:hypothetical protein